MDNRRKSNRNRAYIEGSIAFNNRCITVDCLVRDLSESGAKVIFANSAPLPNEFDLLIRHKETRRARLIWRTPTEAGIEFVGPPARDVASNEETRRVRRLEVERDRLVRRIVDPHGPA